MIEDWYKVEGTTRFEERDIEIVSLELLVKATSIEDACQKARKFLKPIAEFDPIKCEWKD